MVLMLMERSLIIFSVILISASVCIAGRYRFPIQEGSKVDLFYERLQLYGNVVAIGVELLLPFVTGFVGIPVLAFTAALFQAAAVAIFRIKVRAIRIVRPKTSASHSVAVEELRRTRWPYQTSFALGYVSLLAYLATIFRYFF